MRLPAFLQPTKNLILGEVTHIQGFMNLLMKPRNGSAWSPEDRAAILVHLRRLTKTVPILAVFSFPAGSLLLPLLACFLDRRKTRKKAVPLPATSLVPAESTGPLHTFVDVGTTVEEPASSLSTQEPQA